MKSTLVMLCATTAAAFAWPAGAVTDPAPEVKQWQFDVLLDGRRIGEHEFVLTRRGEEAEIVSRADFNVKALFIPLYSYEHENREIWRDGCLASMDARTRDNGDRLEVRGTRAGGLFEVRGPQGTEALSGCVRSFAYWDPDAVLEEGRLLNAQTGEFEPVDVASLGLERIQVGGRTVDAERHALTAPEFRIDLWYSPQGEWLALETTTDGGRKLRYAIR